MTEFALTTVGQLPAVRITAPDGATATVTLYGAHVVSWIPAGGTERMFMSRKSALDGDKAIRGGIPVIFPQFAEQGSGMRHGFARVSHWRHLGDGIFELCDADLAPAIRAAWPHGFRLSLRVAVQGNALDLFLDVSNTGQDAFSFASALHTYYRVDDLDRVRITGVQPGELCIEGKLDRIYRDIPAAIGLDGMQLEMTGFRDAVVWNPGAADAAALSDMEDGEYREFVCIEPALLTPLHLQAGSSWKGCARSVILAR